MSESLLEIIKWGYITLFSTTACKYKYTIFSPFHLGWYTGWISDQICQLNYNSLSKIFWTGPLLNEYKCLPSHTHTLLSLLHVANNAPDGDQAALFTSFSWPSSVAVHSNSPLFLSHIHVVASKLADASRFPQGDQHTLRIVLVWLSSRRVLHTQLSPIKWYHWDSAKEKYNVLF